MRIPARILEHPVESLIAGVLLLALLFGSADHTGTDSQSAPARQGHGQMVAAEKM